MSSIQTLAAIAALQRLGRDPHRKVAKSLRRQTRDPGRSVRRQVKKQYRDPSRLVSRNLNRLANPRGIV